MISRLRRDGLAAELGAVLSLLSDRSEESDPIGWFQLEARKRSLEDELAAASEQSPAASVGLFFGGKPVVGSRGVFAEFGGKAIEQFQDLVNKQHAALDGPVGSRGPIATRDKAPLLIADVARGSFGFILEEISPPQLIDSSTKYAVDVVAGLLARVGEADDEGFDSAVEDVDQRVLGALREFISLVNNEGATLRIVDEERDFSLSREAIERAQKRVAGLEIWDTPETVAGRLYILPEAKRFELHPVGGGASIRGSIAADALQSLVDERNEALPNVIGSVWTVDLAVRELRHPNLPTKRSYRLLAARPGPEPSTAVGGHLRG